MASGDLYEGWAEARLIPVAGIRGQEEQETRATSAFLAVLKAVPAFAIALLSELGAPRGSIQTFSEVRLKDTSGRASRPDGAIIVSRGSRTWRALIEVKTGTAPLTAEQTNRYLDLAREHEFDCVITISNQITAQRTDSPVDYDKRKTRRVSIFHISWWRILTTAVMEYEHRGIADPDQAWILAELIAYLSHEKSGASGFQHMGASWVPVRDAARQGTLRANDKGAREVVEQWEQFVDFVALGLSQQLGHRVEPLRPRKQSLAERLDKNVQTLATRGVLTGTLRVPGAAGNVSVIADLRTRQVTTAIELGAPQDASRQPTRIRWILRQLDGAPPDSRVSASFANVRETSSALLGEASERPERLLNAGDPKREIRSFEIALTRQLGLKNGRSQGSFITETRQQIITFYGEVVQNLTAWQPPAPRLLVSGTTEPLGQQMPDELASGGDSPTTGLEEDLDRDEITAPDADPPGEQNATWVAHTLPEASEDEELSG